MTSRPGDRWPVLSAARKIARGGADFVSPCTLKPLFQRPLNPHTALVADRLNAFSPEEGPGDLKENSIDRMPPHPLVRGLTREPGQR